MPNSKSDEYQTPLKYIKAAREVMGSIDLDPASSFENNKRIKALEFFSKEDSALTRQWFGKNVWLNPPYSKPNLTLFTQDLILNLYSKFHVEQAIYLIPSFTSEKWYHKCLQKASAICLPDHRINFLLNGKVQDSPRMANTFFYFGNNNAIKFIQTFRQFGFVQLIRKD